MIHSFKLYGSRIALCTESGAVHLLDATGFDMLRYLKYPLSENCLSTLRYDLAKYESTEVSAAFERFQRLAADGVFFSDRAMSEQVFNTPNNVVSADCTVIFSGKRPVFATEVIKKAEEGNRVINLLCEPESPVSVDDFDIVESELERIAKEIAKRRLGRIEGVPFTFLPFVIPVCKDEKGYLRITDKAVLSLFERGPKSFSEMLARKCAECALMLYTL